MRTEAFLLLSVVLMKHSELASAQNDGIYPFVNIQDENLVTDNSTTKVFTTKIELDLRDTYSKTIFEDAARSFYGQSSGLSGFLSITTSTVVVNTTLVQVLYDVTYAYVSLRESAKNDDDVVINTIGQLSKVKKGLEKDSMFSAKFKVSSNPSTFEFNGNSICDSITCHQGEFTICKEDTRGVNITCMSMCKSDYCRNGGWCHQANATIQPYCSCPTSSLVWYLGRHCENYVHLWMPVVFGVIVFLLLIIIIAVSCLFYRDAERRKPRITFAKPEETTTNNNVFLKAKSYAIQRTDVILKTIENVKNNGQQSGYRTRNGAQFRSKDANTKPKEVSAPILLTTDEARYQDIPSSKPPSSPSSVEVAEARSNQYTAGSVTTSTSSDESVVDDVNAYDSPDLPRGFDWRDPVPAASTEDVEADGKVQYAVPNKKDRVTPYVSDSRLI